MKVQKRNRITICVSFIRPIISGDGDSALAFAEALVKADCKVSVVSLNPYAKLPFNSSQGSIHIYRSPYFNKLILGKLLSRFAFFPIVTYKILFSDTVIVYGRMLAYKYSLFVGKLFGKKVVFRSTLMDFDDISTLTLNKGIEGWLNKKLFGIVDFYFATTPVFARRWESTGFSPRKVFESPQGVNISRFSAVAQSEKETLCRKLNLPTNTTIICSIGDLCYRKGYDDIAKTLESIDKPYVYIVLGAKEPKKGLWGQKNNAKEISEVKHLLEGLNDKVLLIGLVQNPEEYLKASDIYIHFSKKEGLSNALQQALACGLPMVV
ncbi:MAG TPA: glycosyltransferase family 4 protein, partial [Tenuifilaceae bacterium]|nr:glycosyltransferase family 4 protein [Tenuifilaceae bacterium]